MVRVRVRVSTKATKVRIISILCNEFDKVQKANNRVVLAYVNITNLVCSDSITFSTVVITHHNIQCIMTKCTRERATETHIPAPTSIAVSSICNQSQLIEEVKSFCHKGGCPKGTTKMKENNKIQVYIAARNKISILFAQEIEQAKQMFRKMRKGRIKYIVDIVKIRETYLMIFKCLSNSPKRG